MKLFVFNLFLAFAWASLIGELTVGTLLFGFLLAYMIFYLTFRRGDDIDSPMRAYLRRFPKAVGFFFYYLWEILRSNVQVAYDILTPQFRMKPGVIEFPIEAKSDIEITVLANLISMTPGTLSLDVSDDRTKLYVHAMFIEDPDLLRKELTENLERRVLELLR